MCVCVEDSGYTAQQLTYLFIKKLPLVLPITVHTLAVQPKENGCSEIQQYAYMDTCIHLYVPCSTAEDWTKRWGQIIEIMKVSSGRPASSSLAPPTRESRGALCCMFLMAIFVLK